MHEAGIGQEAVNIANDIGAILEGRDTTACLLAVSMIIGHAASTAQAPDFDGLMVLVERTARAEFDRASKGGGRG